MRILFVIRAYFPYNYGGAGKSVQFIAEKLAEQNHSVSVITTFRKKEFRIINNVKVYYIKTPNLYWGCDSKKYNIFKRFLWHILDSYNIFIKKQVLQILKKEKPDIVHTNALTDVSCYIWKIFSKYNIPIVHTARDTYLLCYKSTMYKNNKICNKQCLLCKILSKPRKRLSNNIDAFVGISKFINKKHIESGYFKNTKKIDYIYNPIELPQLNHKYKNNKTKIIFGFVGRITKSKGIEFLLEHWEKLIQKYNNIELYLYGKFESKSYANYLNNKFSFNKVNIKGFCDISFIYRKIDILIVPSLWEEPFGRVIVESYSYGVPVIASNNGGIPEIIVEGETGYIFDLNKNDFEDKINLLLSESNNINKMRKNCLKYAEKFDINIIIEKWYKIYEKVFKNYE